MIKTIYFLKEEYKEYSNINNKIAFEVKNQRLFEIRRGLYETNINADPLCIANHIVYPSYISFESALSYYNLIPEKVVSITSATFKKNKKKNFSNIFGLFTYQDIPEDVYPYGVRNDKYGDSYIFIATKEKALLDTLYKFKGINSIKKIKQLLFENLRINENDFLCLDFNELINIGTRYQSITVKYFLLFVKEIKND